MNTDMRQVLALISAALMLAGATAHAATFPVTTTNDTGAGSLREAINSANATNGSTIQFAVTNPPRIAIDLPDTVNALNRNQIEAGEGDLKSVSVVQTANRTRLVMNLARNLTYTQALDGRQLLITIDGSQAPVSAAATSTARACQIPWPASPPPGRCAPGRESLAWRDGHPAREKKKDSMSASAPAVRCAHPPLPVGRYPGST